MNLKVINNGEYPNDPSADPLKEAFDKVNHNFHYLSGMFNIKFDKVVWNSGEDTQKAFDTINKNFDKI